jgi:hypothetical protein
MTLDDIGGGAPARESRRGLIPLTDRAVRRCEG